MRTLHLPWRICNFWLMSVCWRLWLPELSRGELCTWIHLPKSQFFWWGIEDFLLLTSRELLLRQDRRKLSWKLQSLLKQVCPKMIPCIRKNLQNKDLQGMTKELNQLGLWMMFQSISLFFRVGTCFWEFRTFYPSTYSLKCFSDRVLSCT